MLAFFVCIFFCLKCNCLCLLVAPQWETILFLLISTSSVSRFPIFILFLPKPHPYLLYPKLKGAFLTTSLWCLTTWPNMFLLSLCPQLSVCPSSCKKLTQPPALLLKLLLARSAVTSLCRTHPTSPASWQILPSGPGRRNTIFSF